MISRRIPEPQSTRFTATQDLRRTANVPDDVLYTVCGWARLITDRNDFSSLCCLEDATTSATHFLNFQTDVDGTSLTCFSDTQTFGSQALTVGQDFFWAIAVSGLANANHSLYYRGAAGNALTTLSASGSSRAAMTPTILRIGASSYGEQWNGRIWNVMCWDRALAASELLFQSFNQYPVDPSALNFWWPMDRGDNPKDWSGNNRHPTITGTLV